MLDDDTPSAIEAAPESAKRRALVLSGLAMTLLGAAPARAQQVWPTRAIRVVVPFSAGGAAA